jgi:UDP-N-acetyl-D-mannosaminuronate dehydrogenase
MSDLHGAAISPDARRASSRKAAETSRADDGLLPEPPTEAPVLVIGLGEVGRPLLEVLQGFHRAAGRDIEDRVFHGVQILHLCFPFGPEFVSAAVSYVESYRPGVVVVNSTVVPGTTRMIHEKTGIPAVYSPVRGKHARMAEELRRYRKFVAGTSASALALVENHFAAADVSTQRMSSLEALELAKLLETTYFGILVGWAQEMDRFAASVGADYWETVSFFDEVGFFPPVSFEPGYIGGHCVMPNLDLLERVRWSPFVDALRRSNADRADEWQERGRSTAERLAPRALAEGR